jgi:hypothetical protein
VRITLDCFVVGRPFVTRYITIGPAHGVYAAGRGSDGRRYYVAVNDAVNSHDAVAVTTRRGTAPCGADTSLAAETDHGDIVVTP